MIPPTPTVMPLGTPIPLEIGGQITLWGAAPELVGFWGQFHEYTPALQWIFVIGLGLALIGVLAWQLRNLSEDEA